MENANRILDNLARMPGFTATCNKKEVEHLMGVISSGIVWCRGHLRQIACTPITDNLFSVKSKSMF